VRSAINYSILFDPFFVMNGEMAENVSLTKEEFQKWTLALRDFNERIGVV